MANTLSPDLERYLPAYVNIESGGNPNARTGSYSGLLQMGPDEIKRYGGSDIEHGTQMLADRAAEFEAKHGRQPSGGELYMVHQQGAGGAAAHQFRNLHRTQGWPPQFAAVAPRGD